MRVPTQDHADGLGIAVAQFGFMFTPSGHSDLKTFTDDSALTNAMYATINTSTILLCLYELVQKEHVTMTSRTMLPGTITVIQLLSLNLMHSLSSELIHTHKSCKKSFMLTFVSPSMN